MESFNVQLRSRNKEEKSKVRCTTLRGASFTRCNFIDLFFKKIEHCVVERGQVDGANGAKGALQLPLLDVVVAGDTCWDRADSRLRQICYGLRLRCRNRHRNITWAFIRCGRVSC